jgi:hypothetical protein
MDVSYTKPRQIQNKGEPLFEHGLDILLNIDQIAKTADVVDGDTPPFPLLIFQATPELD